MPNIFVESEYNLVACGLVVKLIAGGAKVYIKSARTDSWIKHLPTEVLGVNIVVSTSIPANVVFNYVFVFGNVNLAKLTVVSANCKTVAVKSIYDLEEQRLVTGAVQDEAVINFYIGEVIGDEYARHNRFPANALLREITHFGRLVKYEKDLELFIAPAKKTAEFILKHTFSFSNGNENFFAEEMSSEIFGLELAKSCGYSLTDPKIVASPILSSPPVVQKFARANFAELKNDFDQLNFEAKKPALVVLKDVNEKPKPIIPKAKLVKKADSKGVKLKGGFRFCTLLTVTALLFWFFVLPLLPMSLANYFLGMSRIFIKYGSVGLATQLSSASVKLADYSFRRLQKSYEDYPLLRPVYEQKLDSFYTFKLVTQIDRSMQKLLKDNFSLIDLVLGRKEESIDRLSEDIYLDSDSLYKDLAFAGESGDVSRLAIVGRQIGLDLKNLLESSGHSSYMVLFQNSTVPRPSGGLVYAVGIVNFKNGRFDSFSISSIDSLDKQLKGVVKAPKDFEIFSGSNYWSMKDSNWSSDFNISAEVAEWFLDRQIGEKVSGVIAVDTTFMNRLSSLYNLEQIAQESSAAARIDWAKNIIEVVVDTPNNLYLPVLRQTLSALNEKHLLVYFNNFSTRTALNSAGYGGTLPTRRCECDFNMYAVIESWLEGDQSSKIERTQSLNTLVGQNEIVNTLTYWVKSEKAPGKLQLRLVSPKNSELVKIVTKEGGVSKEISGNKVIYGDRSETSIVVDNTDTAGLLISYVWKIPRSETSREYQLYIVKQPGFVSMPVTVKTEFETGSLTGGHGIFYNTDLRRDFSVSTNY